MSAHRIRIWVQRQFAGHSTLTGLNRTSSMWRASCMLLCIALMYMSSAEGVESGQVATATAGPKPRGVPDLFADPPSDAILPASTVMARNQPTTGTVATMGAPGGASEPAVKLVTVQTSLLRPKGPQRLTLTMPDGTNVVIRRRNDVPGVGPAAAASSNGTAAGLVTTWFGEVVQPRGARGPFSYAALTVAENGGLYGEIGYWDVKLNKKRAFQVAPLTLEGVDPAAADLPDIDGVSAASLYPKIDTTRHVLMEIIEPDFTARLAYKHEEKEEWMKQQQAKMATAQVASSTVNTSLPDPEIIPANLTAYYAPLQLPQDATALAEAMAASAGPDNTKKTPEQYLAEAQSALASYTSPSTSGPVSQAASIPAADGSSTDGRRHRKLLQTGNTVIDYLVVYTAAVVTAQGGEANAQNTIRNTVARINAIYANSGVQITLNLVGMRRVTYTEASTDDGTTTLSDAADGRIPNLHAWRDELRADMVSVWTRSPAAVGRFCGWGYITDGNAPTLLYNQIQVDCFSGVVVGHELGHNMGCGHNSASAPGGGGGGVHPYAHGFRRCDAGANNFITVMSYGCDQVNNAAARTAELFSSPSLRVNTLPAGDANTAHCGRTLQEHRTRIAAARTGVAPPPPSGSTITSGLSTSKCLDVPNLNQIGTQMTLFDCHGQQNQRFELLPDGSIRVPGTNRCVDVRSSGTADGTVVQIWDCNGTPAQQWVWDNQRRLRPYAAPFKCLEVPGSNTANGVGLSIRECNTGNNQKWNSNIFPAAFNPQNQRVRADLNGMCLDVFSFNYNNGAQVVMWPCNTAANQQWRLDDRGLLRSTHNVNKCLDAATVNNGSPVYIWDCHGRGNQQWFRDSRNRLRNVLSPSRCLDIPGSNTAQGTRVQLWDCNNSAAQRWQVA